MVFGIWWLVLVEFGVWCLVFGVCCFGGWWFVIGEWGVGCWQSLLGCREGEKGKVY